MVFLAHVFRCIRFRIHREAIPRPDVLGSIRFRPVDSTPGQMTRDISGDARKSAQGLVVQNRRGREDARKHCSGSGVYM